MNSPPENLPSENSPPEVSPPENSVYPEKLVESENTRLLNFPVVTPPSRPPKTGYGLRFLCVGILCAILMVLVVFLILAVLGKFGQAEPEGLLDITD